MKFRIPDWALNIKNKMKLGVALDSESSLNNIVKLSKMSIQLQ